MLLAFLLQETLVVWGKQDQILDLSNLEMCERDIENVSVKYIDDCGHQPHVEQPQALLDAIREWLKL
jgi:pimeloyl-ACP methyl ester carboxylesterase